MVQGFWICDFEIWKAAFEEMLVDHRKLGSREVRKRGGEDEHCNCANSI